MHLINRRDHSSGLSALATNACSDKTTVAAILDLQLLACVSLRLLSIHPLLPLPMLHSTWTVYRHRHDIMDISALVTTALLETTPMP